MVTEWGIVVLNSIIILSYNYNYTNPAFWVFILYSFIIFVDRSFIRGQKQYKNVRSKVWTLADNLKWAKKKFTYGLANDNSVVKHYICKIGPIP